MNPNIPTHWVKTEHDWDIPSAYVCGEKPTPTDELRQWSRYPWHVTCEKCKANRASKRSESS